MHAAAPLALSAGHGSRPQAVCKRAAAAGVGLTTSSTSELRSLPAACRATRSRAAVCVHAFAGGRFRSSDATYERVLRYPDGKVRRIRYPLPPAEEPAPEDVTDGCWATECWVPREQHWGGPAPRATATAVAEAPAAMHALPAPPAEFPSPPAPSQEPERSRLPSSPMELLRYLNSPEHQQAQKDIWQRVRGSYEVLTEVPWVAPRPLFMLASEQGPTLRQLAAGETAPGLTYSLRARVAQEGAESELSRVLKKRAADGSPLIRCAEMRDGVVAFEDEADAERYGEMLEAEGEEVSVARCDSHTLFRSVQDARGVVVLLRRDGTFLPQPHQLATSLRSGGQAGDMFD